MSPEQKAVIRETWRQVVPIADQAAALFYDRLFAIDPALRRLFASTDMAQQHVKLVEALSAVIGALDDVETIVPTLEALGRRHAGYGVTEAHYDSVGEALLWTLEQGLGAAWTAAAKLAWADAYLLIAGVMQRAAAEMDAPAGRVAAA